MPEGAIEQTEAREEERRGAHGSLAARMKAEEERKAVEVAEINRRLAAGTMARCGVCERHVEASEGVILSRSSRASGPWVRCACDSPSFGNVL
jgi:hypothetical protein